MNSWKKRKDNCPKCDSNNTEALQTDLNRESMKTDGQLVSYPSGGGKTKMKCNDCNFTELVLW